MTSRAKKGVQPDPWMPPEWDISDAHALQALALGEANKDQQQRAINWIINKAAGAYDLEYRTDPHDHAFASGLRACGLRIISLIKIDLAVFKEKQ